LPASIGRPTKASFIVYHLTKGFVASCDTFEEAESLAKQLGAPPHFAARGSQLPDGRWLMAESSKPRRKR
jgi:hypothetical protein